MTCAGVEPRAKRIAESVGRSGRVHLIGQATSMHSRQGVPPFLVTTNTVAPHLSQVSWVAASSPRCGSAASSRRARPRVPTYSGRARPRSLTTFSATRTCPSYCTRRFSRCAGRPTSSCTSESSAARRSSISTVEPERPVRVCSAVGRRSPAVTTAVGRAILAFRGRRPLGGRRLCRCRR